MRINEGVALNEQPLISCNKKSIFNTLRIINTELLAQIIQAWILR